MGTRTAEGAISIDKLKEKAANTGKKIKYYVLSRKTGEILLRFVTPKGTVTNGKGKRFTGFNKTSTTVRFLNYWHCYAYGLKLKAQKEEYKKW